jgi:hypothetical protein
VSRVVAAALARMTGPAGVQLVGWEQIASIPARGDAEYNAVVPTLVDANATTLQYSEFFVSAVTPDPLTYYDSSLESGFSIDNLSPGMPTGLAAAFAAGATNLHWNPSAASDFNTFRLYRGSSADFVPASGNLISTQPDTAFADAGASGFYYKLSAVDFNGNESPYALLTPGQILAAPPAPALEFALTGVTPNPARGNRLMVDFTLPVADPARLELVDVAGRRVVDRSVGGLGAGRHVVDLAAGRSLPPGIYLIRLTQGMHSRVARAAVVR